MAVRLTDSAIAKCAREAVTAKARRELIDAGCPGLRLRVTPLGAKSWVLACRDREGRMRRFPIGTFPDTGIADAREAARALRAKVRQDGADPIADARRARAMGGAARLGEGTLGALLDLYGQQRGAALRSWPHSRLRIERVFAAEMKRPLGALTATDLQLAADAYPRPASASFAVRTLRPVLAWAAQRQMAAPALADLHQPATGQRRRRVLSRAELSAILPVLTASKRPHAAAMRFMLLTLARREEVCTARWGQVDLEGATWTIPETKNGQPHSVPLSTQALALLRDTRAAALLPGRPPKDPAAPAPESARPRIKAEDLIFRTSTNTPLGNWDKETKAIQRLSKTSGWHRHDLRRTGATMLGEMGELPDIVEAALNHTSIRSALAATYNRSRYRPQVAAALQRLADALDGLAKAPAAAPSSRGVQPVDVPALDRIEGVAPADPGVEPGG